MHRAAPSTSSLAVLLFALVTLPGLARAQSRLSPCTKNPNNTATVVVPASVASSIGPAGDALEGGTDPDSLAIFSSDGSCAGVSAWDASTGTAISVAGSGSQISGGLSEGESISLRIYDDSRQAVDTGIVELEACSAVDASLQPLCRATASYQKNAVYVAKAIGSYAASLQVAGTTGSDGSDAGWRFIGVPTASAVDAGDLRIGGEAPDFSSSSTPMFMEWNDDDASSTGPTGAYEGLSSTDPLESGRGYALYLMDEAPYALDPSTQITVSGNPALADADPVSVDNLSQTARWHLIANPYPTGYDLASLTDLSANGFQSTVQRYDAYDGTWVVTDQADAEVAAWQAFFVERTDVVGGQGATTLQFDPAGRTTGAPFVGSKSERVSQERRAAIGLALHVTDAQGDTVSHDRAARVVFTDDATTDWDARDASKLAPLRFEYALLALRGQSRADSLTDKAVESRPWPSTLQSIPARLELEQLVGETGTITVEDWALPDGWKAQLVDEETGTTHVIDPEARFSFDLSSKATRTPSRFRLEVAPTGAELPVELAKFDAMAAENATRLEWQTANETNNAGFYVERRIVEDTSRHVGPSGSWSELGFVEGSGTTQQTRTYRFEDTDLPFVADRLVYRLRQVDTDGTVHVSNEVTVERTLPQDVILRSSFPNPARSRTTIQYALPETKDVRLELFDLLGRHVRTLAEGKQEEGRRRVTVNVSGLSSGVYFYRLTAGETVRSDKLTVVH